MDSRLFWEVRDDGIYVWREGDTTEYVGKIIRPDWKSLIRQVFAKVW